MNFKGYFKLLLLNGIMFLLSVSLSVGCKQKNINTKKSFYYSSQSDSLLKQGALNEAEIAIRKSLAFDEGNYVAYNNLGILNIYRHGPKKIVVSCFLKAISIKKDYLVAIYNLANYYHEINNYKNSAIYCTKYLDIANNDKTLKEEIAHMWLRRGECKNYLEHYNGAIVDLKQSTVINGQNAAAYKELGRAYLNLNSFNEAIENYSKAIRINPNYAQAYNGRALCYDQGLKDFEHALSDYNKSIELDGQSATYYFNRGAFLFENNQKKKALIDLKKADSLGYPQAKEYINKFH